MSGQSRRFLVGWAIIWLAGCSGVGPGDACSTAKDCPGSVCLGKKDGFPDGYCSAYCSQKGCGAGQECRAVGAGGDRPACLLRCGGAGDCRRGYQCYQGVCQPSCKDDAGCGNKGFVCKAGTCTARPGARLGAACQGDGECSSDACVGGACVELCGRDGDCQKSGTCVLDRDAMDLRTYCTARRSVGDPMMPGCAQDSECERGSCLMGTCLLLCQVPTDCGDTSARSCVSVPAPLAQVAVASWPALKACLPRNQNLSVALGKDKTLLVPETARSVTFFFGAPDFNESVEVGMNSLRDPDGKQLFKLWDPNDPAGYYRNVIRHFPDIGSSAFLLSASPERAPLRLGGYPFQAVSLNQSGSPAGTPQVTAIYKLLDAPQQKGTVPLRVHVTDLSGLPDGCQYQGMNAANAAKMLSTAFAKVKRVYQQANVGISFDPITFVDSTAPSSVNMNSPAGAAAALRPASDDTGGGVDLVLLRAITPNGILGVAGGIPASPAVQGSPHTGAIASIGVLCIPQYNIDQDGFAVTLAHELGHTLGLSHNREQDGQSDPLGAGTGPSESYQQDTNNLMYWSEGLDPGTSLTAEQGRILRSLPQVHP